MKKRSLGKALLATKCPRCRQGDIFQYPLAKVNKFAATNKNCPKCDFKYELEPGFYYGAMFISYAIVVGVLIISGVLLYHVFGDPQVWVYMVVPPVTIFILLPLIFRYSRTLYIYAFSGAKYDERYLE